MAQNLDAETEQRLQKMLKGAFAGPPTPLKDIPTSEGKLRRIGGKPQRRNRKRKASSRSSGG